MSEDATDQELASLPREELIQRARALQIVLRVAEALSTSRDVTDLARRFVDAVAAYTRFASVAFFRYAPRDRVFELIAERGFDISRYPPPSSRLPLHGSLTGLAASRHEILTTEDIAADGRVEPATRATLASFGYVSATTVPILHQGEILGAFNMIYPGGTALQPHERTLLEMLDKALGLAMAHLLVLDRERDLEMQARRAQQLESLGVLAGGLAHDFNNLLVGIVGCIDVARHEVEQAGMTTSASTLDDALHAAERAAALVRQLLTFSRGGAPTRKPISDIGRVVRDAATFAARGTSVRCVVEVAESLGVIEADPGQIAQVVQNLVLNACQATPRGGTVVVRVTRVVMSDVPPREVRLRVEVVDHGVGIAPEHLARIFEPFYSVREGGTGLGLSVSHSIVTRHGGTLAVDSMPGKGTTFTMELPAGDVSSPLAVPAGKGATAFSGRALVMDDEATVRKVAALMLAKLGFEVSQAAHGEAALELAAKASAEGRPFRVAVLDLTVVGGLGGAEVLDELRRISPGTRMLLSTGYAGKYAAGAGGFEQGWDGSLSKPYALGDMKEALASALVEG
jgi:signal transduction histidine kinase/CheY-like chemotaxis protein